MASMLKRFVVGIGADTKGFEQGQKEVTRGLNNMRSTALISGTAITGMLAGMGLHAVKTAKEMTDLNNAMQFSDADAQYVANMDAAIVRMGGSVGTAIKEYQHFEKILDDLHNKGNAEVFIQLDYAGVKQNDANYIQASKDVQEMQKRIAEVAPQYDDSVVRRMREALGVSEATMVLYSKGADNLQKQLNISRSLIGDINTMKEDSVLMVESWETLKQSATGFSNEIASNTMPAMINIMNSSAQTLKNIKGWYTQAQEDFSLTINDAIESYNNGTMFDQKSRDRAEYNLNTMPLPSIIKGMEPQHFINQNPNMHKPTSILDVVSHGMDIDQLNASVPSMPAPFVPAPQPYTPPVLQQSNKQQPIVIKLQNDNKFEVNGRIFAESVTEVIENINNTVFSGMQGNINR